MDAADEATLGELRNVWRSGLWAEASDRALLAHLRGFSERLLLRVTATRGEVDSLLRDTALGEVAAAAETLRFDAQAHTQFVENVRLRRRQRVGARAD